MQTGVRTIALRHGVRYLLAATFVMFGCSSKQQNEPQVTRVRFGMLPYGDHTYGIIGANKGWFREAGIDLSYRAVKVEDTVPFLRNGSLDVGSCSPGVIIAAYRGGPPVVNFVFGDIFQGYAIMAQPDRGYKSVQDFGKQGMSNSDAIKATAAQLRGKTFAYPTEAAIKPFIDLVISKSGLLRKDFKSLVLDDPLTVNAMRNHQADFQVGGVPSHIVLEREGFKAIITSNDLASAAKPSPDSEELASVFTDGWACTRRYYDQNRPLILRLSGVNFRIMQFIKDHPDEALAIHMPYLSQVTGQTFTSAEGRVIYNSLDPFFTFAEQKSWYTDPNSPFYYKNLNGAIINSFIKQDVFTASKAPSVSDVSVAAEVYKEMEDLKSKAEADFAKFETMQANASDSQKNEMKRAHEYYEAFNYYDAERVASEATSASAK